MSEQSIDMLLVEMSKHCNSCGKCARSCRFLQQTGTPAAIAEKGADNTALPVAYHCSLCGLCDAVCPESLSPSAMFLAMRQEAGNRGLTDLARYRPWLNYESLGGFFLFRRHVIPANCTTVFFPGCSLPGTRPEGVLALWQQLRTEDPSVGLVLDCCGKISRDLGLAGRFENVFGKLAVRLKRKGVTRILTACSGCTKIFRNYGNGFKVQSVYERLPLASLSPYSSDSAMVVIHDPCPSRFDSAQQNAVRSLVQAVGYRIEELPESRQTTRCCGQGGMVEGCIPGTIAREAGVLATAANGRTIVTSGACCAETLCQQSTTVHIVDLLAGGVNTTRKQQVSSARRWLNRLKLRFARFRMYHGAMIFLLSLNMLFLTLPAVASAEELAISRFATEGIKGWEVKEFKGLTRYQPVQEDGRTVIKAQAKGAASGLFKKVELDPKTYRYLSWSWKIAGTVAGGDEKTKAGDDYAARVYVIFPGRFFWQTRAINYIWANKLPRGESVPNAFTGNAILLAVQSGQSKAGQWLQEKRDILADYRRLFGEEPREIGAIAIMTDTDNTGSEATAWYGEITLSTSR